MGAFVGNTVGAKLKSKEYTIDIKDNEEIVQQAISLNLEEPGLQRGQIEE